MGEWWWRDPDTGRWWQYRWYRCANGWWWMPADHWWRPPLEEAISNLTEELQRHSVKRRRPDEWGDQWEKDFKDDWS